MNTSRIAAIGLTGFMSVAAAQVVLPPGPKPAPTPEPAAVEPAVRPPGPGEATGRVPRPGTRTQLPDMKYESLVVKDENGKLKRLTETEARAALRVNPLLDDATKARIDQYFAWRDHRTAQLVIDNLDVFRKVQDGAIESIDFSAKGDIKKSFMQARDLTMPLFAGDPVEDLTKRGVLVAEQAGFTKKIMGEYQQAVMSEVRAAVVASKSPEEAKAVSAARVPRLVYVARVDEARAQYNRLLSDLAVSPSTFAPDVASIGAASKAPEAERVAAIDGALRALPIDQQKTILAAVQKSRPVPPEPPAVVDTTGTPEGQ